MVSNRYIGLQYRRASQPTLKELLKDHDYPSCKFYAKQEHFAFTQKIPCTICRKKIIEKCDVAKNDRIMYAFITVPKDEFQPLLEALNEQDFINYTFHAKTWNALLTDCFKVKCTCCRNQLTAFEVRLKQGASTSTEIPSVPVRYQGMSVPQPTKPIHPVRMTPRPAFPKVDVVNGSVVYLMNKQQIVNNQINYRHLQGIVSPNTNANMNINPEYQWTKCRLCMRILRTRRADASRMRTLQTSHARNHIQIMQFECKLCDYGCRFHGGIQLHISRAHPNIKIEGSKRPLFVDRSKEKEYKNEIAAMVITCFGTEVTSARGTRSQMY